MILCFILLKLFFDKNLSYPKHITVISASGKEFAKTGIIPTEFHKNILDASATRNAGDYGAIYTVDNAKAEEIMNAAKKMISYTKDYFKNNE